MRVWRSGESDGTRSGWYWSACLVWCQYICVKGWSCVHELLVGISYLLLGGFRIDFEGGIFVGVSIDTSKVGLELVLQ